MMQYLTSGADLAAIALLINRIALKAFFTISEPVFEAILENATRMCEAKFGVLFTYSDGLFHNAATCNVPKGLSEFYRQRGSFQPPFLGPCSTGS